MLISWLEEVLEMRVMWDLLMWPPHGTGALSRKR